LTSLIQAEDAAAPRSPHQPARVRSCVFLFLEGGPSHIDTFDPKPKLADLNLKEFERQDKFASAMASGKRYFIQSPFKFRQAGHSGRWLNEQFEQLAGVADELCLYRGCQAESVNHPTACYHMNTGSRFGADPAVGAWVSYGLGSENRDLPSFIVLPEHYYPQGGSANWSSGFLPAHFQGTALRAHGAPILDLQPPRSVTRDTHSTTRWLHACTLTNWPFACKCKCLASSTSTKKMPARKNCTASARRPPTTWAAAACWRPD
jgi:hypothetical protein